jgi:hypothetical protein
MARESARLGEHPCHGASVLLEIDLRTSAMTAMFLGR